MIKIQHLMFVAALFTSGCGLRVPPIHEFDSEIEGQRFVQAILTNISCELRAGLTRLRQAYPGGTFIDDWGIQTTLTLTYDENSTIAPGILWTLPKAMFSLGSGFKFSTDATRKNTINGYYLVSELNRAKCDVRSKPNGSGLLQSDLRLSEWLYVAVSASRTKTVNFTSAALVSKANVLQHQVKFKIVTSGTANPSWRLTRVTINPSGNLFSTSRTRTNDLVITFGQASSSVVKLLKNGKLRKQVRIHPVRQAADIHFTAIDRGRSNSQ